MRPFSGGLVLIFMLFIIEIEASRNKKILTKKQSSSEDDEDARNILLNATPRRRNIEIKDRALDSHRSIHQVLNLADTSLPPSGHGASSHRRKFRKNHESSATHAEGSSNTDLNAGPPHPTNEVPDINVPEEPAERRKPKNKVGNLNQISYSTDSPGLAEARELHRRRFGLGNYPALPPFQDNQKLNYEKDARQHEAYQHFERYTGLFAPVPYPPHPDNNYEGSGSESKN